MALSEEVIDEYKTSLKDLHVNSKPLINMLTMLAEDHEQHAPEIVKVIEDHINKVDEKTRASMFKLRQTWTALLPNPKLYMIDVRINNLMDPAWPITATPPEKTNIHVNPKFLNKAGSSGSGSERSSPEAVFIDEEKVEEELDSIDQEAIMRQQLIAKQLELQQVRIQLELAEAEEKLKSLGKHATKTQSAASSKFANLPLPPVVDNSDLADPLWNPPQPTIDPRKKILDPRVRDPRLQMQPSGSESESTEEMEGTVTSTIPYGGPTRGQVMGAQGLPQQHMEYEDFNSMDSLQYTHGVPPFMQREFGEGQNVFKGTVFPEDAKFSDSNDSDSSRSSFQDTRSSKAATQPKVNVKDPRLRRQLQEQSKNTQNLKAVTKDSISNKNRDPRQPAASPKSSSTHQHKDTKDSRQNDKAAKDSQSSRSSADNSSSKSPRKSSSDTQSSKSRSTSKDRDSKSYPNLRNTFEAEKRKQDSDRGREGEKDSKYPKKDSGSRHSERSSRSREKSPGHPSKQQSNKNSHHKGGGDHSLGKSAHDHRNRDRTKDNSTKSAVKKSESHSDKRENRSADTKHGPSSAKSNKREKGSPLGDEDDRLSKKPKLTSKEEAEATGGSEIVSKKSDDKVSNDLSDLFGSEDIDYRPVDQKGLPLKSPSSKGWDKFKASQPDQFAYDIELKKQRQDVDQRRTRQMSEASENQDTDLRVHGQGDTLLSPPIIERDIPKELSLSQHSEIIIQAQKQLREGKITAKQHQDLMQQVQELMQIQQKLQEENFKTSDNSQSMGTEPMNESPSRNLFHSLESELKHETPRQETNQGNHRFVAEGGPRSPERPMERFKIPKKSHEIDSPKKDKRGLHELYPERIKIEAWESGPPVLSKEFDHHPLKEDNTEWTAPPNLNDSRRPPFDRRQEPRGPNIRRGDSSERLREHPHDYNKQHGRRDRFEPAEGITDLRHGPPDMHQGPHRDWHEQGERQEYPHLDRHSRRDGPQTENMNIIHGERRDNRIILDGENEIRKDPNWIKSPRDEEERRQGIGRGRIPEELQIHGDIKGPLRHDHDRPPIGRELDFGHGGMDGNRREISGPNLSQHGPGHIEKPHIHPFDRPGPPLHRPGGPGSPPFGRPGPPHSEHDPHRPGIDRNFPQNPDFVRPGPERHELDRHRSEFNRHGPPEDEIERADIEKAHRRNFNRAELEFERRSLAGNEVDRHGSHRMEESLDFDRKGPLRPDIAGATRPEGPFGPEFDRQGPPRPEFDKQRPIGPDFERPGPFVPNFERQRQEGAEINRLRSPDSEFDKTGSPRYEFDRIKPQSHEFDRREFDDVGPPRPEFDKPLGHSRMEFDRSGFQGPEFERRGPPGHEFMRPRPPGHEFDRPRPPGPEFDRPRLSSPDHDRQRPSQSALGGHGPPGPDFDRQGPSRPEFDKQGPSEPEFDRKGLPMPEFNRQGPPVPEFDRPGPPRSEFDRPGPIKSELNRLEPPAHEFDRSDPRGPEFDRPGPSRPEFDRPGSEMRRPGPPGPEFDKFGPPGPKLDRQGPPRHELDRPDHWNPDFDRQGHPGPDFDKHRHPEPDFDRHEQSGPDFDRHGRSGPPRPEFDRPRPWQEFERPEFDRVGPLRPDEGKGHIRPEFDNHGPDLDRHRGPPKHEFDRFQQEEYERDGPPFDRQRNFELHMEDEKRQGERFDRRNRNREQIRHGRDKFNPDFDRFKHESNKFSRGHGHDDEFDTSEKQGHRRHDERLPEKLSDKHRGRSPPRDNITLENRSKRGNQRSRDDIFEESSHSKAQENRKLESAPEDRTGKLVKHGDSGRAEAEDSDVRAFDPNKGLPPWRPVDSPVKQNPKSKENVSKKDISEQRDGHAKRDDRRSPPLLKDSSQEEKPVKKESQERLPSILDGIEPDLIAHQHKLEEPVSKNRLTVPEGRFNPMPSQLLGIPESPNKKDHRGPSVAEKDERRGPEKPDKEEKKGKKDKDRRRGVDRQGKDDRRGQERPGKGDRRGQGRQDKDDRRGPGRPDNDDRRGPGRQDKDERRGTGRPDKDERRGPLPPQDVMEGYIDKYGDPRFRSFTDMGPEVSEEVVFGKRNYEIKLGAPPRKIQWGNGFIEVYADPSKRGVVIDNELMYRFGERVKEVNIRGKREKIFYHGKPLDIWIDGNNYEVRVDSPPKTLIINNQAHRIQVDGRDMMILIDKAEMGPYGGEPRFILIDDMRMELRFDPPPRHILIDGEMCELKLNVRQPCINIKGVLHGIRFKGPPRDVFINGSCYQVFTDHAVKLRVGNRFHYVALGGPCHELIVDGKWYEVKFDEPPKEINVGNRVLMVRIPGGPPEVKILEPIPLESMHMPMFNPGPLRMPMPGQPMVPGPRPMGPPQQPIMPGMPGMMLGQPVSGPNPMVNPAVPGLRPPMGPPQTSVIPGIGNMIPGIQPSQPNPLPMSNVGPTPGMPTVLSGLFPARPTMPATTTSAPAAGLDINSLLSKLVSSGIIKKEPETIPQPVPTSTEVTPAPPTKSDNSTIVAEAIKAAAAVKRKPVVKETFEEIPDKTSFDLIDLKELHGGAVQRLYAGAQCTSCGARFLLDNDDKADRYKQHLDWHFRQNKLKKDDTKVTRCRKWYYGVGDWIQYEEVTDLEDQSKSVFFEQQNPAQPVTPSQSQQIALITVPEGASVIKCPPATGNDQDDLCNICHEPFEQFWHEEHEEWHLREAIRVNNKTYHPICYEDYTDVSEGTPSPSVLLDKQPDFSSRKSLTYEESSQDSVPHSSFEEERNVPNTSFIKTEPVMSLEVKVKSEPQTVNTDIITEVDTSVSETSALSNSQPDIPIKQEPGSDSLSVVKQEPMEGDNTEGSGLFSQSNYPNSAIPGLDVSVSQSEPMETSEEKSVSDHGISTSSQESMVTDSVSSSVTDTSVKTEPVSVNSAISDSVESNQMDTADSSVGESADRATPTLDEDNAHMEHIEGNIPFSHSSKPLITEHASPSVSHVSEMDVHHASQIQNIDSSIEAQTLTAPVHHSSTLSPLKCVLVSQPADVIEISQEVLEISSNASTPTHDELPSPPSPGS